MSDNSPIQDVPPIQDAPPILDAPPAGSGGPVGITNEDLHATNRLRRRERWRWRLVWWVSTLAWAWYRVSGVVMGTRHPRCHTLLRRFWQWVFWVKGMMVVRVHEAQVAVQGRLIVYPRAHDYDAGLLMQVLPPGVLVPLPDPWRTFRVLPFWPSPWGPMMQRFSYPDLGTTVQCQVIKTLLKRGYSVAVPINPIPQVDGIELGIEPGMIDLLTDCDDIWVMGFMSLMAFSAGCSDVTVPVGVTMMPLNQYVLPHTAHTDEGLMAMTLLCGYQRFVRLPRPASSPRP